MRERVDSGRDGVAAATAAAGVFMRASGKGDGNGARDGDNDDKFDKGNGFNGNEAGFAGRPEFTEAGTEREGAILDGTEMTPADELRASARKKAMNLIAFGDGISTV